MKIRQRKWTKNTGWSDAGIRIGNESPQLVLVFGASSLVSDKLYFEQLKKFYPSSHIVLSSTAGEIFDTVVSDGSISVTDIYFEKTQVKFGEVTISKFEESYDAGKNLANQLPHEDLIHVMVFSDGLKVNGSSLSRGLRDSLPPQVSVTGGLVGDGADFKHTFVGLDKVAEEGKIIVIGFYGNSLKVGYGSLGGWDPFGPERLITKSKDNILYELDNKPALKLYKDYLGELASGLPGTGLLFPITLNIKTEIGQSSVVRTVLAVDEIAQSMTFAGDMPEGTYAKLMKANLEKLIDGAIGAASMSVASLSAGSPELVVLVSCVGRKVVLKENVDNEIEAVRNVVGANAVITGFYSYGEICPTTPTEKQCHLHNQTMTVTLFKEI